jgi:hypothetical protein
LLLIRDADARVAQLVIIFLKKLNVLVKAF